MECNLCNQIKQPTKELKNPCYPCDSCRHLICLECSKLTASEIRCLPLSGRVLKFHCSKCRNYDFTELLRDQISDKCQIIKDKDEIIEILKTKITDLESKINEFGNLATSKSSYADIAKNSVKTVKNNCPKIIIKPKMRQNQQKTKEDIEKNVKLQDLKIGVQKLQITNSGDVIIKCLTKEGTEVLEKNIKEKLSTSYNIELSKMRKPRIKIVNFRQDMNSEQIEKCISEQNHYNGTIKVNFIRNSKSGSKTIICECCPTSFNHIIQEGKVCIGWERYTLYEDLDIPRCYNCQGYYHKSKDCQNAVVCSRCGEDHQEDSCPKLKVCCKNCTSSNLKYKTKYPTDHYATDLCCGTLEYLKEALRNKTTYG